MKFEVDRDVFAAALGKAAAIALNKDNSTLRNVVLRTSEEGKIEIIATDLEISLLTFIEAQVEETGAIGVPAKQTLDIVRGFIDGRVVVESGQDGHVRMQAGKSRRRLPALNPEDFPLIEVRDTLEFHGCDKASLVQAMAKSSYCIPRNNDAYSVSGLFLLPCGDSACRAFASDGHRLAYQDSKGGFPLDLPEAGIAIPLKGVQQMLHYLEAGGEASLADPGNNIILKTTEGILILQLLEAHVPTYEMIIPEERPYKCSLDVEQLQVRLNSLAPLATGKWNRIGLSFSAGRLGIEITTPESGSGEDEMAIEYDDEEFTIYLNHAYLKDICKSIGGGKIDMEWVDDKHAIVLLEPKNPGCLHLIMPIVA